MVRRSKQQATSFFTVLITDMQEKHFLKKINDIDSNTLQQNNLFIIKDLLFGSEKLKENKSNALLKSPIAFIQSTERDSNIRCFSYKQPVRLAFTL